jgi:NTP pyrophosphatase (non-canonical NTP hydrolase)
MATSGVLIEMARQCMRDSHRWFPDTSHSLPFMVLALCGEVGELANIVKKVERGSLDMKDARTKHAAVMEATDVLIYLMDVFAILGVDPEQAYNMKRVENEQRFGPAAQNGKRA